MTQDELKQTVAQAALDYCLPKLTPNAILGIGTGSTANYFIDLLATHQSEFAGTVASSKASADRLARHGIPVLELNDVNRIQLYVDGTDESNKNLQLIKGGGAALTREKIVASASDEFVCIADESKWVSTLGAFPLPIEVIPMALGIVSRALRELGGDPRTREGVITDNQNLIIDLHGLSITHPVEMEAAINQIPGVVTNGLFAQRKADVLLLATHAGIKTFR